MPKKINFSFQRNELYVEEDFQFLPPFKNKLIQVKKLPYQKFSVWNWIYFFQAKKRNLCGRKLSIFATFKKMYPDKNFQAKLFQCLKLNTIFSTNGSKCMGKQNMTIHFFHLLKIGFRQVLPCQKISVFEVEYSFLISGTNCMWKKNINFCHLP